MGAKMAERATRKVPGSIPAWIQPNVILIKTRIESCSVITIFLFHKNLCPVGYVAFCLSMDSFRKGKKLWGQLRKQVQKSLLFLDPSMMPTEQNWVFSWAGSKSCTVQFSTKVAYGLFIIFLKIIFIHLKVIRQVGGC